MPGHGGGSGHLLHALLRHQQELGLTEEQVTKMKALALEQDRQQIHARADLEVADRELRSLRWDDKAAMNDIETKLKERAALEVNVQLMSIKARRALLDLLTPEQRDKLKVMRQQMPGRHHERRAEPMPAPEVQPIPSGGLQAS
jgi:Spy/CpxP family protein refolding chaperone